MGDVVPCCMRNAHDQACDCRKRYGRRNVPKMIAQIEALRRAIRAEGTPAIQDAWDKVEEHIDYAYRREGRDG